MGSLLMDKNEKQWYFSCALQRQNRYLNMKEVLFNKLQRLKEETKYLGDIQTQVPSDVEIFYRSEEDR